MRKMKVLHTINFNYDSDMDDEWTDDSNFHDQSTELTTRNLQHKNLVINFDNMDESIDTSDNEFEQNETNVYNTSYSDNEQDDDISNSVPPNETNIQNVENMDANISDESDNFIPPNETTIHNTNDENINNSSVTVDEESVDRNDNSKNLLTPPPPIIYSPINNCPNSAL